VTRLGRCFRAPLAPPGPEVNVRLVLEVACGDEYPDAAPAVAFLQPRGLSDADLAECVCCGVPRVYSAYT
jgi:hypothetical protein